VDTEEEGVAEMEEEVEEARDLPVIPGCGLHGSVGPIVLVDPPAVDRVGHQDIIRQD
jgi:hypothetical protein